MNNRLVNTGVVGKAVWGAAVLAKKQGYESVSFGFRNHSSAAKDLLGEHGIEYEEGMHSVSHIMQAGEVVKSPVSRIHYPWWKI
jgi:UDP-N-acetylmuramoylalanine--D-glutamate ligase